MYQGMVCHYLTSKMACVYLPAIKALGSFAVYVGVPADMWLYGWYITYSGLSKRHHL